MPDAPDRSGVGDGRGIDEDRATDGGTWVPSDAVLELERSGVLEGFVPLLDLDRLGVQTVLVTLCVPNAPVEAVLSDHGAAVTDAFELTGSVDLFLVARFTDLLALDRFLASLATDDRVETVSASLVGRTVCEYEFAALLE